MSQSGSEVQAEVEALQTVLPAIAALDEATRRWVLRYLLGRFGLDVEFGVTSVGQPTLDAVPSEPKRPEVPSTLAKIADIRMLKEQKKPKNAVEMAVLVAFYLREVAPEAERKATIRATDIERYFKQADHPLPRQPRGILSSAKNSGYLDSGARGQYSLNPVGYNLVAHSLPRASGQRAPRTRRVAKSKAGTGRATPAKKATAKKAAASKAAKKKPTAKKQ